MGVTYRLDTSAQVTLNGSGYGAVSLVPRGTERWHVTRIAVSTNQASSVTTIPICTIYTGSIAPGNKYDATFTGNDDATDANLWLEKGQPLWAEWKEGPTTGVIGTISVYGERELY